MRIVNKIYPIPFPGRFLPETGSERVFLSTTLIRALMRRCE